MDFYCDDPRVEEFMPIALAMDFPVDALVFVIDALRESPQYAGEEPGDVADQSRHCTAAELCHAITRYARDLWGKESTNVLRNMKILRSEDVGRIVFALVDADLIEATSDDQNEHFSGVCRFAVE